MPGHKMSRTVYYVNFSGGDTELYDNVSYMSAVAVCEKYTEEYLEDLMTEGYDDTKTYKIERDEIPLHRIWSINVREKPIREVLERHGLAEDYADELEEVEN